MAESPTLELSVAELSERDQGRGVARLDPDALGALGLEPGDLVAVGEGAFARALPTRPEQRGQGAVFLDPTTRANARTVPGRPIRLARAQLPPLDDLLLEPVEAGRVDDADFRFLAGRIDGIAVVPGNELRTTIAGGRTVCLRARSMRPDGGGLIVPTTRVRLAADEPNRPRSTIYGDIGGLGREIDRLRELVELPMRHPELFRALGITPPRGVLLHGPPGTGKTLLARAVASEADATFFHVSAPEIMQKFYGESEARLRALFERAEKQLPAIVFIDEIDAIARRRDQVEGEVEKRVVAQLLTLLDGLRDRGDLVVIAATNLPNLIDPALRRPGRLDRELAIGMPNREARAEILAVHTRRMPLAEDVSLAAIAEGTHGFTGADLRAVCQEAAMCVVRRLWQGGRLLRDAGVDPPRVDRAAFLEALTSVIPSTLREVAIEAPDVRFEQVGGYERAKERLHDAVLLPLTRQDAYRRFGLRPPRGVILHGPPGTGKTLFARATACEAGVNLVAVSGPELLSRFLGDSERAVREIFDRARQAAPCLLFFDELDAVAMRRGSAGNEALDRVVAQLLTEMAGIRPLSGVVVLAATNRLDRIDPALLRPGRFDEHIELGPPTEADRRAILTLLLAGKPAPPEAVDELAPASEGLVGADLESLVQRAFTLALRADPEAPVLTLERLRTALEACRCGGVAAD